LDFGGRAITVKSVGGADKCIIDCENSGRGFYFHSGETSSSVVEGFTIKNGNVGGGEGGGVYCYQSSPTFNNCNISNNRAYYGGGVYCYPNSSPTFNNCVISNNTASNYNGGGVLCGDNSNPTFNNCNISNNTASDYGGGVLCGGNSNPTFNNCNISNNTVVYWYGGGVFCSQSSPTFNNCVVSNNGASYGGGVACSGSGNPTFKNSIIWGNSAPIGNQIYTASGCTVTLSYCDYANGTNDVKGYGTVNADNCINSDPQFVDPTNKNYRLKSTSPCIDIGNNSYIPSGITTDLDGKPRIYNGTVDLGPYEYQP